MPHIQIKDRFDPNKILFEGEYDSLKAAILAAVAERADLQRADLRGADLRGADLRGADLRGADLRRADLRRADLQRADLQRADLQRADLQRADLQRADLQGADLRGADLQGADLQGADLRGADLRGAYLQGADLRGADLRGADLRGADLQGADLQGADLRGADLRGARLNDIKADVWMVLTLSRDEVPGLLAAIRAGKIDGSAYEGSCACLVGTLANVRQCQFDSIPGLLPDASRPSERWFTGLKPGDTPENSQIAKITEGWIVEWLSLQPGYMPSANDSELAITTVEVQPTRAADILTNRDNVRDLTKWGG